jgi:acetyltransferase
MANACGATVYPVNPQHATVFYRACHPSILEVPGRVDLAVIATHATAIPEIVGRCIKAHVRAAVGLASGFRERGPEGWSLENAVLERARAAGLRILGPNSLRCARSRANQADHRLQGRPHGNSALRRYGVLRV